MEVGLFYLLSVYQKAGEFTPVFFQLNSSNKKINKYKIYYPKEILLAQDKHPVIIAVNGIHEPAQHYSHVFEHLASWGFIVVGNHDLNSWSGFSTTASLNLLLCLNDDASSPLFKRVDVDNIGLLGHSEGGVGAINAINNFSLGRYYKTVYTASMPSLLIANFMSWSYDVSKIEIPYCMVQGTRALDSVLISPHQSSLENYNKIPDKTTKIKARYVNGTHVGMLWKIMSGYTAWFMWHLKNDKNAEKIFATENATILVDKNWVNVEKNF